MKILKPVQDMRRPEVPVMSAVLATSTATREEQVQQVYEQLVTRQGLHPDRAKALLGLT